jgi:hypothetical protein
MLLLTTSDGQQISVLQMHPAYTRNSCLYEAVNSVRLYDVVFSRTNYYVLSLRFRLCSCFTGALHWKPPDFSAVQGQFTNSDEQLRWKIQIPGQWCCATHMGSVAALSSCLGQLRRRSSSPARTVAAWARGVREVRRLWRPPVGSVAASSRGHAGTLPQAVATSSSG